MTRIQLLNSTYTIFAVSSQKLTRNVTGFVQCNLHFFALYGICINAFIATRTLKNKAEIISFYRADFILQWCFKHVLSLSCMQQHISSRSLAPTVKLPGTPVLFICLSKTGPVRSN